MCSTIPIHVIIKSPPASPGKSRVGPSLYVFSLLGSSHHSRLGGGGCSSHVLGWGFRNQREERPTDHLHLSFKSSPASSSKRQTGPPIYVWRVLGRNFPAGPAGAVLGLWASLVTSCTLLVQKLVGNKYPQARDLKKFSNTLTSGCLSSIILLHNWCMSIYGVWNLAFCDFHSFTTLLSKSEIYNPKNALGPASLPNLKYKFPKWNYKICKK